ncbi:MAG TPA: hypothetical protein DD989_06190, partial [Pseudomonas sp.]|nr:hypothetical protein [Pseudomonas sp.]
MAGNGAEEGSFTNLCKPPRCGLVRLRGASVIFTQVAAGPAIRWVTHGRDLAKNCRRLVNHRNLLPRHDAAG